MENKIGILTLHNAINYGAYLQAFALQSTIREMGYNAEIVNLEKHNSIERLKLIKCKHPKRVVYNYKLLKEFDKVKKQLFLSRKSVTEYSTIIVGSDEMWNVINGSFVHRREYFGEGIKADNIITYAVSANKVTSAEFKTITNNQIDFGNFRSISVRDDNTYKLVKDITRREVALVLDPTMIYPYWEKHIVPCIVKNFILVYSFTTYEDEKVAITEFAKKNNKKIISVGSYNPWCDENICATPFEFLGYIKAADYVITSSFHGVAFSILFNKKFVIYPQGKGKVLDIMNRFELHDRDVTRSVSLEATFQEQINYDEINKKREAFAKTSLEWLTSAINSAL